MENDVAEELTALKAQLQILEQARSQREAAITLPVVEPQVPSAVTENAQQEDDGWLDGLDGLEPEQILERLKDGLGEWFDELNAELKDTKPSTVLTIFGLGVLIGRLTN
jgi:hypothetical protein